MKRIHETEGTVGSAQPAGLRRGEDSAADNAGIGFLSTIRKDWLRSFPQGQVSASIALALLCGTGLPASAAIRTVTSLADDNGANTLRSLIGASVNGDTINFAVTGTISLTNASGELGIEKNLTIAGPGAANLSISGNNSHRVFNISNATTVNISGLTIRNGRPSQPSQGDGGGIRNFGSLTVESCVVASNIVECCGRAGGIYNSGSMHLTNSKVAFNAASSDGGGILNVGTMTIDFSEISTNQGGTDDGAGAGGAIANDGTLVLNRTTVTGNSHWRGGLGQTGGIVNRGQLTAYHTIISGNFSELSGAGGLENSGSGTAALYNCVVRQNNDHGVANDGLLIMRDCEITDNGACHTFVGGRGGGLENGGTAILVNCAVIRNIACRGGFGPDSGFGGGIWNRSVLALTNCTLSANEASGLSSQGGGVWNGGLVTFVNCTVASNSVAGEEGGGIWNSSNVVLKSSLVAGNLTSSGNQDCGGAINSQGFNLIQNTNGCAITNILAGNIYGQDPLLGPLQNNGGPTATHALLQGSPAIDKGSSSGVSTDQRGLLRPADFVGIANSSGGDGSDIGAYEVQVPPGDTGLRGLFGDYFDNNDFTGKRAARIDPTVNFDWGNGQPHPSIGADTFSVRWTGKVQPRFTDTYSFYTLSDDGVRLWVNGQLLIDNWTLHGPTEDSGSIALVAGQLYDIRMEFFENEVGAVAKLSWSSLLTPKEIIPQTQLYPTPTCVTAPDGLVGWWPGDFTAIDLAGRNDGTPLNGATYTTGRVGPAFSFDGVNDSVLIGNPPELRLTNGITIDAWIYPRLNPGSDTFTPIVSKAASSITPDAYGLYLLQVSGGFRLHGLLNIEGEATFNPSGGLVPSNQWSHVAVTYDSITGLARLHLNGAIVFSNILVPGTLVASDTRLFIGGEDSAVGPSAFAGLIDEVEIFNRALDPAEIEQFYLAGSAGKCRPWTPLACVPAPFDLLAWWTGDGTADDRLGHYNGTWIGPAAYEAGEVGAAFSLVGATTHYVQTANSAGLNPMFGGFTIEAWVNISRRNVAVVGKGLTSPFDYSFGINNTGAVRMAVSASQLQPPYTAAGGVVTSNQWHHIAGVFQPFQSVTVFLDGNPVGSVSAPDFQPPMTTNLVTIGRANGFGPLAGGIDELCFYNRALTVADIATLYAAGTGGKCWQPYLRVRPVPQGMSTGIELFWPVSERWYRLQQAPVVSGGTWTDVLAMPACTNNECQLLLPAAGNLFFRLVAP